MAVTVALKLPLHELGVVCKFIKANVQGLFLVVYNLYL